MLQFTDCVAGSCLCIIAGCCPLATPLPMPASIGPTACIIAAMSGCCCVVPLPALLPMPLRPLSIGARNAPARTKCHCTATVSLPAVTIALLQLLVLCSYCHYMCTVCALNLTNPNHVEVRQHTPSIDAESGLLLCAD